MRIKLITQYQIGNAFYSVYLSDEGKFQPHSDMGPDCFGWIDYLRCEITLASSLLAKPEIFISTLEHEVLHAILRELDCHNECAVNAAQLLLHSFLKHGLFNLVAEARRSWANARRRDPKHGPIHSVL